MPALVDLLTNFQSAPVAACTVSYASALDKFGQQHNFTQRNTGAFMDDELKNNAEPLAVAPDFSDLVETVTPEPPVNTGGQFAAAIGKAAKANNKRLAAQESRELAAEIEKNLEDKAERLLGDAAQQNTRLGRYGIKLKAIAYIKAPAALYKEPVNIVQAWLEIPRQALKRTSVEIVRGLREKYAGYDIRADFMSRPLHANQQKQIRSMLVKAGIEASASDCRTLSKIRKRLLDHHNRPEYEVFKPVIKFAIDGTHIIWNGSRYSVFQNSGAPSIKRDGKTISVAVIRKVAAG